MLGEAINHGVDDPNDVVGSHKRRPINLGIYLISVYLIWSCVRPFAMWAGSFGEGVGIIEFLNRIDLSKSATVENVLVSAVTIKTVVAVLFIFATFLRVRHFRHFASVLLIIGAFFYGLLMVAVPREIAGSAAGGALFVHPLIAIGISIYLYRRKKVREVFGGPEQGSDHHSNKHKSGPVDPNKGRPINRGIYIISLYLLWSAISSLRTWSSSFGEGLGILDFLNMINISASASQGDVWTVVVVIKFFVALVFILFAFCRIRHFRSNASFLLILGALFYVALYMDVVAKFMASDQSAIDGILLGLILFDYPLIAVAISIYLYSRKKVRAVYGQ